MLKRSTIAIVLVVIILSSLAALSLSLRAKNRQLSVRLSSLEKNLTIKNNSIDDLENASQEYRKRLVDLQMHIQNPEKIAYDLPYDTNTYSETRKYLEVLDYRSDNCRTYSLIFDASGNMIKNKASNEYDACIDKYLKVFTLWNPYF